LVVDDVVAIEDEETDVEGVEVVTLEVVLLVVQDIVRNVPTSMIIMKLK